MNIMDVKDGEFYVSHGETYECIASGTAGFFDMYDSTDECGAPIGALCALNNVGWQGIRPATIEEIRQYKAASPRYPECSIDECGAYFEKAHWESEPFPVAEPEPKHSRKVVQITSSRYGTVALCDDGTIWDYGTGNWKRCHDIPQE